ncbi:MAG: type I-A CRISPR-associated protein Cas4/Csa1 [Sulfolobales archaeon]
MISPRHMLRSVRRLYDWARKDPVDEDLRGWNWDKQPLKPRAYLGLSVSEISSIYCRTRRDLWLKRKLGVKLEPNEQMIRGLVIHEAISKAVSEILRHLFNQTPVWEIYEYVKSRWREIKTANGSTDLRRLAERVYKHTLFTLLGEISYNTIIHGAKTPIPILSEYRVDGSNLGLSPSLSIDVLTENVIIDFKYGSPRNFHKLALAGYALALESDTETPWDYGVLVYISDLEDGLRVEYKPVYIDNSLRKWFVDERDSVIDMLIEDREPPLDTSCSQTCPLYKVCRS